MNPQSFSPRNLACLLDCIPIPSHQLNLSKQSPCRVPGIAIFTPGILVAIPVAKTDVWVIRDRATGGEEQDLDGERETHVQGHDEDEEDLARLTVGSAEDGVKVPQEESYRHSPANAHEHPVQDGERRPADEGHGDPDQVRVAVEGPALEQVRRLGAEVAQRAVEDDGDHERVAVD